MKSAPLLLITFYSLFLTTIALDVEIEKDFTLTMEYRLESQSFKWNNRGAVIFLEKGKKNHKSSIEVNNEDFTKEIKDQIIKECDDKGTYYIRFTNAQNILYSSLNPCELIKTDFRDKIIINALSSIKEDNIISINYMADNDSDTKSAKVKTAVDIVSIYKSEGPIFEDEEKKKTQEEASKENQSFLSKYWWIIVPLGIMMLMGGGGEEEGQEGQGGQQQASS